MIAAAKAAAHVSHMGMDLCRLEASARRAQQMVKRLDGLRRRLHADHDFQCLGARVVPCETAFGLEKHRVDGLRLEVAGEHKLLRIVHRQPGTDLIAVEGGLCIGRP
jgi:hypothetical protein